MLVIPLHEDKIYLERDEGPEVFRMNDDGSLVKRGYLYNKDHEWVMVRGTEARIGITDHAQKELTEIVFIELPKKGTVVKKGEPISQVESIKTVVEVYAPISGKVVEVNSDLESSTNLINESPYDKGWIAVILMSDPSEKDDLLSPDEYSNVIAGEPSHT